MQWLGGTALPPDLRHQAGEIHRIPTLGHPSMLEAISRVNRKPDRSARRGDTHELAAMRRGAIEIGFDVVFFWKSHRDNHRVFIWERRIDLFSKELETLWPRRKTCVLKLMKSGVSGDDIINTATIRIGQSFGESYKQTPETRLWSFLS
jgi:hypothetical protein